jgi:hypothetical protein
MGKTFRNIDRGQATMHVHDSEHCTIDNEKNAKKTGVLRVLMHAITIPRYPIAFETMPQPLTNILTGARLRTKRSLDFEMTSHHATRPK